MCYLRKCNQFVSVNPLAHTCISVKETTGNILVPGISFASVDTHDNCLPDYNRMHGSVGLPSDFRFQTWGNLRLTENQSRDPYECSFLHTCEYQHIIHMRTIHQMRVAPTMYTVVENRSDVSLRRDLAASSLGKQPHKKRRLSFKYSTVLSGILMIFSEESA